MAKVVFHTKPDLEAIELQRMLRFKQMSDAERMKETFKLIELTIELGSEKSIKKPQGKGIVLRKNIK